MSSPVEYGLAANPYTGPSMPVKLQYHTTALVPADEAWAWLEDGWTRVDEDNGRCGLRTDGGYYCMAHGWDCDHD